MSEEAPLRPADLARLLLAGDELMPRERARDQQSDLAGIAIKREVLNRLAVLDPEPDEFEAALDQIIVAIGPPYGPTRGVCLNVRYDWEAACSAPEFVGWLLEQAIRTGAGERRRKGGRRAAQTDQ
jgi:hypothetical protein